jgi:hypothetical protein
MPLASFAIATAVALKAVTAREVAKRTSTTWAATAYASSVTAIRAMRRVVMKRRGRRVRMLGTVMLTTAKIVVATMAMLGFTLGLAGPDLNRFRVGGRRNGSRAGETGNQGGETDVGLMNLLTGLGHRSIGKP